jgi:flagella basal body P-ring formation protein FlgA
MDMFIERVRISLAAAFFICAVLCVFPGGRAFGEDKRVLCVRDKVHPVDTVIRLKDIVTNTSVLSDHEKNYIITDSPRQADTTISIIDLAYLLQQHESLLTAQLSGSRYIVFQKATNVENLDRARKEVMKHIRQTAPWRDWETDILFNTSDETMLAKGGDFTRAEVMNYDNKGMLGTVAFRVTFFDDKDRQIEKVVINPVILRKVSVHVMSGSCPKGHILQKNDVKSIPLWVGAENREYIAEESKCVGKELANNMTSGDIIKTSGLLNPVCAKKGDMIWVEYRAGALTVRMAATAMENGREGDSIKLINQITKKEFDAELIGEKEAVKKI